MKTAVKKKPKKRFTSFRPIIFSRHPSHSVLRSKNGQKLDLLPFRSVVRFGSVTPHKKDRVECNTIEGVKNSMSKLRMKKCFLDAGITSPTYYTYEKETRNLIEHKLVDNQANSTPANLGELNYPIIAKLIYGSRGNGMRMLNNRQELETFINNQFTNGNRYRYYFEEYRNLTREYRLHITEDGCFYTNRKMLKSDTPEDKRFFRNDSNSSWFLESNPKFDKPSNWKEIEDECVKSLKAVGLDIGKQSAALLSN